MKHKVTTEPTNAALTIHPVVYFYRFSGDELEHASLCFLSKELLHESIMVYQMQKMAVEYLKSKIPTLQGV